MLTTWRLVVDTNPEGPIQTTATLPLAVIVQSLGPCQIIRIFPNLNLSPDVYGNLTMSVQDYNEWISNLSSVLITDLKIISRYISANSTVNTLEDPIPAGTLWYDTESRELSIWYMDDDSGQWVPTSNAYSYDDDIAALEPAFR